MDYYTFVLAIVQLIYYLILTVPIAYIFYTHGSRGRTAWVYFSIYVLLQIIGNAMIVSVGRAGTPSYTAQILVGVSLTPVLMGAAGILQEWASTTTMAKHHSFQSRAILMARFFHLAAVVAVGLIAGGGYAAAQPDDHATGEGLLKVGAVCLFLVYLVLVASFAYLALTHARGGYKSLLFSLIVALPILGIRYIYELLSIFSSNPKFSSTTGDLGYRAALEVAPNAAVILIFIIGGILARDINLDARLDRQATIPLRDAYETPTAPPGNAPYYYAPVEQRAGQRGDYGA